MTTGINEPASPYTVYPTLAAAAEGLGLPINTIWEGVDSPCHVWHAPAGEHPTLVALLPGWREACPELYL